MNGHWNEEQLIQHLYGVGPDDGHVNECVDCQTRLSRLEVRARQLRETPEVDGARLLRQRQAVLARIQQPVAWWSNWKLVPAGAAGLALVAALAIYVPSYGDSTTHAPVAAEPSPAVLDAEDAKLLGEVSAMASSDAPVATVSSRGLLATPELN